MQVAPEIGVNNAHGAASCLIEESSSRIVRLTLAARYKLRPPASTHP
jgi:hypothetical protein